MRTLSLTLVAIILATGMLLSQGTLSVPFTADQQKGVQFELDRVNVERAAQNPPLPALVLQAFGIQVCQVAFTRFASMRAEAQEVSASVREKYLGLSDADKATVEALIDSLVAP